MYHVHTTPGFIIDSRPYGEAGKILSIFTREFGLVAATAQGIRLEKSKLRYHTVDHTFGTFSLIRGKEFWRLTSAQEAQRARSCELGGKSQELLAKIALLLRRLLHGEEPHPELFDVALSCATFLDAHPSLNDEQLASLESLIVLRILNSLGYVGTDPALDERLKTEALSLALLDDLAGKRIVVNQHINKALRESQL